MRGRRGRLVGLEASALAGCSEQSWLSDSSWGSAGFELTVGAEGDSGGLHDEKTGQRSYHAEVRPRTSTHPDAKTRSEHGSHGDVVVRQAIVGLYFQGGGGYVRRRAKGRISAVSDKSAFSALWVHELTYAISKG